MRASIKIAFIFMFGFSMTITTGCAPTLVSISTPEIQTVENSYYSAQFEPLSDGKNFFEGFRLSITNKTSKDLQIDWNKTRYLYNGRDLDIFVFKGIQPNDIKNLTLPPDIIPAERTFSKEITPLKLLAREPLTGSSKLAGKITSGPIPSGKSGILLFIRQNSNQIKENLTVNITEKKLQ